MRQFAYYCPRMGLIEKIKSVFTKSATVVKLHDTVSESTLYSLMGQNYAFGTHTKDFLLKAYGLNPYVFMVVDRICQRLVQIDKKVLDKTFAEIDNPLFTELIDRPNARDNGDAFLYRAAATYLSTGECFVVRRFALGESDEYFVPVNYNVTINQDTRGNVIDYTVSHFTHSERYLKTDVLHICKPDITFDTNHGFSTLRANRKVWESNNEVWGSEASLHKNKGITGILYADGNRPMTPTEEIQLQEKYEADNTGQHNFGKVRVSTTKLGYIPMGMNPNDLKSIETRLEHLRTICASYNVDSKLFGDSAASTYNNMAEAQRAFIINAVLPLSRIILPEIVGFISKRSLLVAPYSMELDEEDIHELQITKEQKSARLGREVIQGLLTTSEAREMLYPELVVEEDEPSGEKELREPRPLTLGEILSLQQALMNETITRDAAVAALMYLYGLDETTANQIIG
jgi:HK97 family phage portal protein